MSTPSLASLIASQTKDQILTKLLQICQVLGLTTESWQSGDPTRSTLASVSARWAEWEDPTTGFPAMIRGGLLGLARGPWLKILLANNYNVTVREATFAQCTLQITNTTSSDFGSFDPNDITAENPHVTGSPTFRNDDAFSLGPNAVVTVTITAEQAGSASNSDAGDIDTLVTTLDGVTVTNLTAATALDDESDSAATARGQQKLESVSPAGPRGAYEYMLTTPEEQSDGSNQTNVTRVHTVEDSDYGDAIVFIAGASGALSGADVDKGQNTIEDNANPLVVNAQVLSATNLIVNVTYELWVYDDINLTTSQIQAQVSANLAAQVAQLDIGGDIIPPATSGFLYIDWLKARIIEAVDQLPDGTLATPRFGFKCSVSAPASDVPVAVVYNSVTPDASTAQVVVLGAVTGTIHLVTR